MKTLHTNADLLNKLKEAAKIQMTAEQIKAQRVSFIYGQLSYDGKITKDQIERELDRHNGL